MYPASSRQTCRHDQDQSQRTELINASTRRQQQNRMMVLDRESVSDLDEVRHAERGSDQEQMGVNWGRSGIPDLPGSQCEDRILSATLSSVRKCSRLNLPPDICLTFCNEGRNPPFDGIWTPTKVEPKSLQTGKLAAFPFTT